MKDLAHNEYSVGIPDDWEDRTEVILKGPRRDGTSPTLTVSKVELREEMTLAQFAAFQRHGLEVMLSLKKLPVIEEGETTLGGAPAYMRVYNIQYMRKTLTQRQVYAVRGKIAYVITETSAKEHYADDRPTFEAMIAQFKFLLPPAQ